MRQYKIGGTYKDRFKSAFDMDTKISEEYIKRANSDKNKRFVKTNSDGT